MPTDSGNDTFANTMRTPVTFNWMIFSKKHEDTYLLFPRKDEQQQQQFHDPDKSNIPRHS